MSGVVMYYGIWIVDHFHKEVLLKHFVWSSRKTSTSRLLVFLLSWSNMYRLLASVAGIGR